LDGVRKFAHGMAEWEHGLAGLHDDIYLPELGSFGSPGTEPMVGPNLGAAQRGRIVSTQLLDRLGTTASSQRDVSQHNEQSGAALRRVAQMH
jgi:hypothetical protein